MFVSCTRCLDKWQVALEDHFPQRQPAGELITDLASKASGSQGGGGLWSHEEAATYLGITKQTLHFINHKGRGPKSYKVGRYRRYRQRDIDDWLETQCVSP
ncbi:helix-turn-helix domain-containing protein [Micromonospora sp. ALFpr18c]|uniref:helix-turn-helix domain-containing protein n=1 Tax=Micromonospora sp. ALFpr18c TaxID=1458665 RepID=UPI001CEDCED7|nr:helix-turn-helix domain-containing protein [Micromonospora sp. ALFpr18c]